MTVTDVAALAVWLGAGVACVFFAFPRRKAKAERVSLAGLKRLETRLASERAEHPERET